MIYLWMTILSLLNAVWLFLVFLGLPGHWLMVICTSLFVWWQWDGQVGPSEQVVSVTVLILIALLALGGEVFEFFACMIGSKRAGGSKWGAGGAIVGTLVGGIAGTIFIPIPVIGSVIGACAGAALGALLFELFSGRRVGASVRSGVGAGVGRLGGMVGKIVIGVVIWTVCTVAVFWP